MCVKGTENKLDDSTRTAEAGDKLPVGSFTQLQGEHKNEHFEFLNSA